MTKGFFGGAFSQDAKSVINIPLLLVTVFSASSSNNSVWNLATTAETGEPIAMHLAQRSCSVAEVIAPQVCEVNVPHPPKPVINDEDGLS